MKTHTHETKQAGDLDAGIAGKGALPLPQTKAMNALLVHPLFPLTYWGLQHGLRLVGKKAALPPLGLITLAALLPSHWQIRLVDLNVEALRDEDFQWADMVLMGGMLIQMKSMHEIVERAHSFHIPAVVGGPAPTTSPDLFVDADVVFRGEAEGRIEELVRVLTESPVRRHVLHAPTDFPDMKAVIPVPRFDLLDLSKYASVSIQYSRGCPFRCEFCDIVEIFGRTPRMKEPEQVVAELEAIYRIGYRGSVFFVDDNFIGNKKAVKHLLQIIREWQRTHGRPFEFYTEVGIGLAADPTLLNDMVDTGFTSVFIGIETPSTKALEQARKFQNLRFNLSEAIDRITRAGLEVMGGFIVGFDSDTEAVFTLQQEFIARQPIPLAMAGILMALPGTALWRRLKAEGRLRERSIGDQFSMANFVPMMDERTLIKGYANLMERLYSPKEYYSRCELYLSRSGSRPETRPSTLGEVVVLLRTIWHIGILSPQRRHFWRLMAKAVLYGRDRIRQAVVHAVQGEHFIRYTREYVLPRLENAPAKIPPKIKRNIGTVSHVISQPSLQQNRPYRAKERADDHALQSQGPSLCSTSKTGDPAHI